MAKRDHQQTVESTGHMRVSANFGRRFALTSDDTPEHAVQARTSGKRLRPVTGDRVLAHTLEGESDWLITRILDRDNELVRPDARGRPEVLAANIERIAVVACPSPAADFFIVDRYLAAAQLMGVPAIVVWNKSELGDAPEDALAYRHIGYTLIETSAKNRSGIDTLHAALADKRSIFVGQSGVGKSSLINALCGDERQRTADISHGSDEGKHTTVAAQLIVTTSGIALIDSPGVRDYAPSIQDVAHVGDGFIEIARAAQLCKFANCRHRAEPGCAVKTGVEDGEIQQRRYTSFLRLAQLTRQLNEGRY
ncbi:MAG: ribosome small subunit-dependent GTPase A [Pseudomonadota bacterium]